MKQKVLKPFDLEKAKLGAKLSTRDGRPARVICWNRKKNSRPIMALIENKHGEEDLYSFTRKGRFNDIRLSVHDLMLVEYEKECQFKPFDKVLVRDMDDEEWTPAFYADYDEESNSYVVIGCFGSSYNQCIPFEGNEHLVGTNKKPE